MAMKRPRQRTKAAQMGIAADYIHRLRTISDAERAAIIDRTAGSLTAEEGDELARIIEDGCEQIDEETSLECTVGR